MLLTLCFQSRLPHTCFLVNAKALENCTTTEEEENVAEGITEMNPELMEQMARLKQANAALQHQVDRQSQENTDSLEQRVDDAERLTASYEVMAPPFSCQDMKFDIRC